MEMTDFYHLPLNHRFDELSRFCTKIFRKSPIKICLTRKFALLKILTDYKEFTQKQSQLAKDYANGKDSLKLNGFSFI